MTPNKPTLSIITATYQSTKYLPDLIASLQNQTCKDFEWVVADGNSTDGTIELLKSTQGLNLNWHSEHDFGIYDAMNKAVKRSSGEYYLVMGSDDILAPDAVENILNALADDENIDVLVGQATTNGQLFRRFNRNLSWLHNISAFVHTHSVGTVFRKNLHLRFGYYSQKFPLAADAYFIKTIFQSNAIHAKYYDVVHGIYGTHGISSTATLRVYIEILHLQLITEKYPSVQILLFIARYIKLRLSAIGN
jgi:glycosyltransferase involved in cell wall biosynthesis